MVFFLFFAQTTTRVAILVGLGPRWGVLQNLSRAVEPAYAARAPRKAGRDTLMMSCDAPRQLTASSERFSRATPTIWSTGERAGVRLALKVHEVRRDVHRAYARCRPTPGPARARPRRRDPLVSRRVGSGKRRRSGGARAEAPEVRGGRGLLREPVPRVEAEAYGCGLVPDAGICSFSSPRSASFGEASTTLETGTCCGVEWSTDGDAPKGVQGIVSGLHEESDRDQRALLRPRRDDRRGAAAAADGRLRAPRRLRPGRGCRRALRQPPRVVEARGVPRAARSRGGGGRVEDVLCVRRAARTACCLICWTAARAQRCSRVARVVGCEVRRRAAEETLDERVEERFEERVEVLVEFDSLGVSWRSLCNARWTTRQRGIF